MFEFDNIHPALASFSKPYELDIRPQLEEMEGKRQKAMSRAKNLAIVIIGITLFLAFLIIAPRADNPVMAILMTLGFGGLITVATFYAMLSGIRKETKNILVTSLADHLNWHYQHKVEVPFDLDLWRENRLLPSYDKRAFEDQITGQWAGSDFKLMELTLKKERRDSKGNRRYDTVFQGLLFEADSHRKMMGKTIVLQDRKFFQSKAFNGMKRVGLVDPVFEEKFEAYGTDQVGARYLLTPDFMQQLVDLETSVKGSKIRFGFFDARLLVAIEAKNQFEAGSMLKPLTDTERLNTLIAEFDAILRILESLAAPSELRKQTRNQAAQARPKPKKPLFEG